MSKKLVSVLVYGGCWLIAVLAQCLLIGSAQNIPWNNWSLYYITWIVDIYLILLFYINYFGLAPMMIRKSLYKEYVFTTILAVAIGFFLPIILNKALHWTMPGMVQDVLPISSLGPLGAVAVMSIGLAIRGVREWAILTDKEALYQRTAKEQQQKIQSQEDEIRTLRKELSDLREKERKSTIAGKPVENNEVIISHPTSEGKSEE